MSAPLLRDSARVYIWLLALIAIATCGLLAATSAHEARELLPLRFGRVPATPRTALSIALTNARVALVPLALSLLAAQGPAMRTAGDCVLAAMAAFNAAELGAAVAGYGPRALAALAPHTPVELAAYAVAGAAYLAGRRACPPAARLARLAALCGGLLVLAAVLETYVQVRPR